MLIDDGLIYSRTESMYHFILILLITTLLSFSPNTIAKKRCKPLLAKLHNVQALQRNGYSVKRGVSLRAREDKARADWWQCENGKKKKAKSKKTKGKSASKNNHSNRTSHSVSQGKIKAGTPFETTGAIVIKSKYQGRKKQAWLAFYQQPKRCQRPKSIQTFAFCSEDKQKQRLIFEQGYQ